jgi:hypothetical protein
MQHLIGKTIQFTSKIEDMEAYPEKGMRARIVSISPDKVKSSDLRDHVYKIVFDYTEFDQFNATLEASNYYDRNGVACLTARQANMYEPQETIYFGSPELWPFEDYFILLNDRQCNLIARFKESGEPNYVEWLENQI